MEYVLPLSVAAVILSACVSTPSVVITDVDPAALPASVIAAIEAERTGFTISEVQKKVRDGRTYYDVEGELADTTEIEFDILMEGAVAHIVEIQRDLEWDDMPEPVQAMVDASEDTRPVRIIESIQTDGAIIYEFFAPDAPADPAYEIRSHAGKLERLTERWMH